MSLAPRAVLVHRTTEYEELLARHGTHGQAEFFLSSRGRSIEEVARRHGRTRQALADVAAAVPLQWRQSRVERADLDRFLFGPEDVVVVVGQDGLVANVAKYLSGQPVVGIDTDPGRNPGVLVRHRPGDAAALFRAAASPGGTTDDLTMVEAVADDTQRLLALNEIYLGPPGHQTARYRLGPDADGAPVETAGVLRRPGRHRHRLHRLAAFAVAGAREHPGAARPRPSPGWSGSYARPGRRPRPARRWWRANSGVTSGCVSRSSPTGWWSSVTEWRATHWN